MKHWTRRHRPGPTPARTAFTLVELITSIVISTVISGIAGTLILNAARQRSEVAARVELVDVAARACEQMLRYTREVPQDIGLTGLAQITTASATEIRFGNDGFRLSANVLEMTLDNGAGWHPLTRDVSAFTLSYFKADGTALNALPLAQTDRESVRLVRINLQLTRGVESATVQSSIYLRNFMNEVTNAP
ncbi:MAG: type II secretion system protein [Phycisphaerae bacterium]